MSDLNSSPPTSPPAVPPAAVQPSAAARIWSAIQLPLTVLIAVGALAYLLWPEGHTEEESASAEVEIVKLVAPHRLTIEPGTPLQKKLAVVSVISQEKSSPQLKVTGSVVARLAPADHQDSKVEGRWDFNTPDLAGAYADWLKARNDVPFQEAQRINIFKLSDANLTAKAEVAERLEKLVKAGTDPVKDLVAAKADLLQTKIQGEKDKHEAQTNVDNANRTLATLERQLFQAGIDPELLLHGEANTAVVVAEVPEARISQAQPGDPCAAQFYAFPEVKFEAVVGSVSPSIAKERRTLRVFFRVNDPRSLLKPGMFADVNLFSNDKHVTLLVPADGVLHVGLSDYVLVSDGTDQWKVTQVKAGEQLGSMLEIVQGLRPGDRVIGAGAILLKPYVVEDVQAAVDAAVTGPAQAAPALAVPASAGSSKIPPEGGTTSAPAKSSGTQFLPLPNRGIVAP